MRTDIILDLNTNDIKPSPPSSYVTATATVVDTESSDECCLILQTPSETDISKDEISFNLPYSPVDKPFTVTIRCGATTAFESSNRTRCPLFGYRDIEIHLCQLPVVASSRYRVAIRNGTPYICSGEEFELTHHTVSQQNTECLLKCCPGNYLRYPTVGVGLVRWINGGKAIDDLAGILKEQLGNDGVSVQSATYDFDTQTLNITRSKHDRDDF